MTVFGPKPDFTDEEFPELPYPGTRPSGSFAHLKRAGYFLTADSTTSSGWRVGGSDGPDLDQWLYAIWQPPMAERLPVLAYGSNANPSKISWLREELGLVGPALVMRARCTDIAAVWSAGFRARDHQRPAVLSSLPGITEDHTVWYVTPDQRRILDLCEGRGERYQLSWLRAPIELEDGQVLKYVLAYTARPSVMGQDVPPHLNRSPLLVDGRAVRCADVDQDHARLLEGTPATSDGLHTILVGGEP